MRRQPAVGGLIQTTLKKQELRIPDLDLLENILAYKFQNRALLERAVTHRSWAHEQVAPGAEDLARRLHNESLEFLGDSVLGLVVADYLCNAYPEVTEGELSRMKHRLVSAPTLAMASLRLSLGDFLRFGRGEEKSGGRSKDALLADVLEALTGAIFLDGGLTAATALFATLSAKISDGLTRWPQQRQITRQCSKSDFKRKSFPRLGIPLWKRSARHTGRTF